MTQEERDQLVEQYLDLISNKEYTAEYAHEFMLPEIDGALFQLFMLIDRDCCQFLEQSQLIDIADDLIEHSDIAKDEKVKMQEDCKQKIMESVSVRCPSDASSRPSARASYAATVRRSTAIKRPARSALG